MQALCNYLHCKILMKYPLFFMFTIRKKKKRSLLCLEEIGILLEYKSVWRFVNWLKWLFICMKLTSRPHLKNAIKYQLLPICIFTFCVKTLQLYKSFVMKCTKIDVIYSIAGALIISHLQLHLSKHQISKLDITNERSTSQIFLPETYH